MPIVIVIQELPVLIRMNFHKYFNKRNYNSSPTITIDATGISCKRLRPSFDQSRCDTVVSVEWLRIKPVTRTPDKAP